jgi:hypothetical protein
MYISILPWHSSVTVKTNTCKYCGEHFQAQVRSYACVPCREVGDYVDKQDNTARRTKKDLTIEQILERE